MNALQNATVLEKAINTPLPVDSSPSRSSSMVSTASSLVKGQGNSDTFSTMPTLADARHYAQLSRSPSIESCAASIHGASMSLPAAKPASWSDKLASALKSVGFWAAKIGLAVGRGLAIGAFVMGASAGAVLGVLVGSVLAVMPGRSLKTSTETWLIKSARYGCSVPAAVLFKLEKAAETLNNKKKD